MPPRTGLDALEHRPPEARKAAIALLDPRAGYRAAVRIARAPVTEYPLNAARRDFALAGKP